MTTNLHKANISGLIIKVNAKINRLTQQLAGAIRIQPNNGRCLTWRLSKSRRNWTYYFTTTCMQRQKTAIVSFYVSCRFYNKEIFYLRTVIVTANLCYSRNELINRIRQKFTLLYYEQRWLYDHQPVLINRCVQQNNRIQHKVCTNNHAGKEW